MWWNASAWLYQRVRFLSVCYLSKLSVMPITLWFNVYLITRAYSFSTYYLCEEEFWGGKSFFLNYIYPILAKQSITFPNLNGICDYGYKEWPAGFHINLILLGCVSHNKLRFFSIFHSEAAMGFIIEVGIDSPGVPGPSIWNRYKLNFIPSLINLLNRLNGKHWEGMNPLYSF